MAGLEVQAAISSVMARELATSVGVCVRPVMRRVTDRQTDTEERVAIPCGATRESQCPSCAKKARILRMQQCAEGWHRTDEPSTSDAGHQGDEARDEAGSDTAGITGERQVRSTRRRDDAASLPRVPTQDRTVGIVFSAPDGRTYQPSMFLTLTLGSYGPVAAGGVPTDPAGYDYRRAALDALHFSKLWDRFVQNLRRCAGYRVQYFAAVEPQARLAPHIHAAIRGAIPREVLRQVIRATYEQVWWPAHDEPVFTDRLPVWDGEAYSDPETGETLPTWREAVDQVEMPAHVLRFGRQHDMRGIIAPSVEADRAVRYLTKYLTKSISDPIADDELHDHAREAHIDRMHAELRWLPCSPRCANWLRFGVQPDEAGPDLEPGECRAKAHDREHLGLGGRRVLVSRQWSGKTLAGHRADRATVVREALHAAGIIPPEVERLAAETVLADGHPRFVWTDTKTDPATYVQVILDSIAERQRWRTQYEQAKQATGNYSATGDAQPP